MWRNDVNALSKRLKSKLLIAQSQLSDVKNTSITDLKTSHTILTKLLLRSDNLKANAPPITNETSKRRKGHDQDECELSEFTELLLDVEEVIAQLEVKVSADEHPNSHPNTSRLNSQSTSTAKLPKLTLKQFSGDITQFYEFWEMFKISVEENEVDDIPKFVYLKSLLIGDAEKLISGLPTTKENYKVAKDLLFEKYGNKEQIIQRLYQRLNEIPKATKQTLRKIYDEIESVLRALEAVGENIEGGALLSIVSKKYPEETLLKVMESTSGKLTVSLLRNSMKDLLLRREQLPIFLDQENKKLPATTEALFVRQKPKHNAKICRYCTKDHFSDMCEEYSTIEARKKKIKGSCFICLREGHNLKHCKSKKPCVYCNERSNHHRSLCPKQFNNSKTSSSLNKNKDKQETVTCLSSAVCLKTSTLLIANAVVRNGSKQTKIRLIFDNGSARSYITNKLFAKLHLQGEYSEALQISTFGKQKPVSINTKVASVDLKLINGEFYSISANTVPLICENFSIEHSQAVKKIAYERQLNLASDDKDNNEIDMLIGLDYYFHLVTEERIIVEEDNSFLVKSKLGWLVAGNVRANQVQENPPCLLIKEDLTQLWDLDTIGIKVVQNDTEEDEALSAFYNSITYEDNNYSVSWPWKCYPPNLPSNYQLAYGRLKTLYKRLDPPLLQKYNEIIQKQCESGVVEKTEIPSNNICHYLPHHPVITPNKSTECRIVYDGSAKSKKANKSLNDCLYKGKVLLEQSCALLLRFRFHKFAIIADIEKAFLRIGLHHEDRDTTRFLWIKNINKPPLDDNLQTYRFTKIPFGVISSPFLLSATIHYHLMNIESEFCPKLLSDFYVDNLITGVSSLDEGKLLYTETKKIFERASMNLRNWKSNSQELNIYFVADQLSQEKTSVLGIIWDTIADNFTIKVPSINKGNTKREILQTSSAVFDPMGWFAPVTLQAKLLLKRLWQMNVDWDEPLSASEIQTWQRIFSEISLIKDCNIPRLISNVREENIKYDLHTFVDASQEAYGAVSYLRFKQENSIKVELLFAKARVAPKKGTLTIPKLELLAALIGVRMLAFIKTSLFQCITITESHLWSDSQCVLTWIKSKKVLPSFIEHRIREIRQHSEIQFHYVPSLSNPADMASRGCTLLELQDSIWWYGPQFLKLSESNWPQNEEIIDKISCQDNTPTTVLLQPQATINSPLGLEIEKFTSLRQLLEQTAYRLKAGSLTAVSEVISGNELHLAENFWIRITQETSFPNLDSPNTLELKKLKKRFNLWKDLNGIWRCRSRLQFSELPDEETNPILLPAKGKFVILLILHYHEKLLHAGVAHTLAELRKLYWIIRGRASVFHCLKKFCANCTYFDTRPFQAPPEPPLPKSRITVNPPFTTTGLDVFGPLYTISKKGEKAPKKVWCLLFTCFVTRAIHLELLSNMTTDEFLLSFRSFVASKGRPTLCVSDNAPQFKLSDTIFEKLYASILEDETTTSYFAEQRISWKFIPPKAAWMGGVYERLIGLVKTSLKKTLFQTCITKKQLQTLLTEIAAVINSRPLLYVGENFPDDVLSPARLLGFRKDHAPLVISERNVNETPTAVEVIALWKKTANLLTHFWTTYKSNYLKSLQERYTAVNKRCSTKKPEIGTVVLVHDAILPRIKWTVGQIIELIPSEDGLIRSVKVKCTDGLVLVRPITKLYPLEMHLEKEENDTFPPEVDSRKEFDLEEIEVEEISDNE